MKITKQLIQVWLLLFIPFVMVSLFFEVKTLKKNVEIRESFKSNYVGSKFSIAALSDSNNNPVKIDLSRSDYTIIDFWFRNCPSCIADMNEFEPYLKGRQKQISVISISINSFKVWASTMRSKQNGFRFLSAKLPNWQHLVLRSKEDPALNNDIPMDNSQRLTDLYNNKIYPLYLVLDKKGTIVATPVNAVNYIKTEIDNENADWVFITTPEIKTHLFLMIPELFVTYSGCFWIITIIVMGIIQFRNQRST